MAINRADADATLVDCVAFMDGSQKSSNKDYDVTRAQSDAFSEGAAGGPGTTAVARQADMDRRNLNRPLSSTSQFADITAFRTMTPYQVGQTLHGRGQGTFAGNCGIQGCLAIYIAQNTYQVPLNQMWLYTVEGDYLGHSFCVMTDNVYNTFAAIPQIWTVFGFIVDPWLNFVSRPQTCCDNASTKLKKWDKAYKRVNVKNWVGSGRAWVDPTSHRVTQCLDGVPSGRRADGVH